MKQLILRTSKIYTKDSWYHEDHEYIDHICGNTSNEKMNDLWDKYWKKINDKDYFFMINYLHINEKYYRRSGIIDRCNMDSLLRLIVLHDFCKLHKIKFIDDLKKR